MAITASTSQLVPTMMEQVRPKLQSLEVKLQSAFAKMFEKAAEKHNVSAWTAGSGAVLAWRIPVELSPGGDMSVISLDGGDLGTGSMMNTAYMTIGAFETDVAFNIPARSAYATKTQAQAISNVMQKSIGGALKETALYNEIGLFNDGVGVIATATAVSGSGNAGTDVVYTLETANFTFDQIRGKGQLIDIADSGLVLRHVGARVKSINFAANQVTITAGLVNYTPSATDRIVFPGMGPITSTTLASGSFRYGLYTYNTTNTTGSLLGLAYSNAYELACPTVNMSGGFFTPSVIFAGKSQLIQRRDDEAYAGIMGVCHMAQRTGWYLEGITIANQQIRPGESAKNIDLAGQGTAYGDTFEAGDITHHVSRYASKSRVDWFSPKNMGYVQLTDLDFFQSPEGQRIFVGRSATTGNPTAGFQFYIANTRNYYSADPGCSMVAYNGAIPAGQ